MKKEVVFVSVFALLFAGSVFAASTEKNPFDEIWNAITEIKNEIANIELIPGPQGEKGDKGDQGEQGPQGEKGDSAGALPVELEPKEVVFMSFCNLLIEDSVYVNWSLSNEYGPILSDSGVSWGEIKLYDSTLQSEPIFIKANGYTHGISFGVDYDQVKDIPEGSPVYFKGYVYWNGFTVPMELNTAWVTKGNCKEFFKNIN